MEETKDPFIVVRDVCKIFGKGDAAVHALSGIDLDIYREEYISIMAENGRWKACVANDGYFSLPDSANRNAELRVREIFLHSNALFVAHCNGNILSLYLEDDCDGSRVFHPYRLEKNMDI